MRTEIQAVSTPKENIVLPVPRLPFQHPALRQKPRFGETPTDTARDSELNLDDIAEQPDTARPKSPVAKITDSNDDTTLLRGLPVLGQEIRYRKGEFLAVRNTDNGIFLCQTTRPIIGTEPQTRIRWLTQTEINSNTYVFDYHDYIVPQCILTNVRLEKIKINKYRPPQSEQERAEVILWASIAADKRGHSASPTCQGGQKEVQTEIINPQTTLPKKVVAEGIKENKESS